MPMLRSVVTLSALASVACFQMGPARPMAVSAFTTSARAPTVSAVAQRPSRPIIMADEPSPQESAIAVALTGAFVGIYVLDNIITAGVLAGLAAYATTTDSQIGDIATSTGMFAAKAYKSTVKFVAEKDLLPKAKTVTDKVVSALQAVDNNYGITAKLDEKLMLSDKLSAATEKFTEVTSTVKSKVNDLTASMK